MDIHIHTCLSPCAEITSSPKRVVERASECGLNLIFITDHNSIENVGAAMRYSVNFENLSVYPGMEITSKEEVHTLALFENLENAYNTQDYIYKYLPDTENEEEYKYQIIANENDEVEGYLRKSLFSAVDLSIKEVVDIIHSNEGIAVAAHIDRPSFSIISQLGFIPDDIKFDALEISPNLDTEEAREKYMDYSKKYRFLSGSDSHSLEMIGKVYMEYFGEDNSFNSFLRFIRQN